MGGTCGYGTEGLAVANILVVDDAAFMRLMIKDMLVEAGHTVVGEAVNGLDAIEKYRKLKPDLVTMDITMPDMEGVDALKEIRRLDPRAVVIMCSAMGQKQLIVEAIKSGAKDFIVKPLQTSRVIEAISKALVGVR
jgi:two-component system, chemotaxis family, chemotaxis protein CheY